jgi:hypothetical protein
MSHRSLFINVTALVLLVSFSARSQGPAAARPSDEAAAKQKKAIELLKSVAGQMGSLRSAENRARIGSNVADLLWDHDEKRSRSLFASVQEDINAGLNDADSDQEAHRHTLMVFARLRGDTLERIAKHDPELALEFLRATRPAADPQLPYEMREDEKALELRLAGLIAAKNPQLALKLGMQSLAKGLSSTLLPVLAQLQQKDKDAARSFYQAIVDKLKDANLAQDYLAMELILTLAHEFPPPLAEEQVYRDLMGVLLTGALANGCGAANADDAPPICFQFGQVFSRIEKYYGQRAAPLKRWAEETQGVEDSASASLAEVREVMGKGTVDEILALAAKYPDRKAQLYWRAMTKAKESGDVAKARQIASEFPDEGGRRYMLAQIDREQMWKSVNADKLAALQQGLSSLRSNEERVQVLLYVASQVSGNDPKASLGLLNQAGQILDSMKAGKTQLEKQVALATLYCSLKSDRGFALMESLVPKLNELVAAASVLDGVDNNYLREGEWTMTSAGGIGALLTRIAQNAGYFVDLDFDRSVALSTQFERSELRVMAASKIAQAVLSNERSPAVIQTPLIFR